MGCFGKAKWKREEVADHKFDFIDVRDYYSNTFFMRFKYMFVFIFVAKSFAVYVADIYTAITLLALNHFNGNVYQRVNDNIQFNYAKWIFTGCIMFGFLLLAYEAHKARQVIRSRDISYAYTNVMANNYYSMRSYDHYCFFSQINNSKKKKDEFAFFIFFTFKGWKRLLVADGPRQVINGLTLFWIARASNFSTDLYDYYEGNFFTAAMLLTMIFTVVIFAGSAILLTLAALMYVPLICYIQGNLKDYCCHKIDKRISELVQKKKKQRLGKYAAIARAEAAGDFSHLMNKQGIIVGQKMVQPTLPKLDIDLFDDGAKQFKGQYGVQRTHSMSSSTVNGLAEKGFYGVKDGDDYASTAQLMMNQGHAGSAMGHAYPGTNLSTSSGTLYQSNPGTSHNSPDSYPVHVRGMQGMQDLHRANGGPGMANVLANMGPIGTSPALFAQRKVGLGQAGAGSQQGAFAAPEMGGEYGAHEIERRADGQGDAYEMTQHRTQTSGFEQSNSYGEEQEHLDASYPNTQNGYPSIRLDGNEMDISAYAPYNQENEQIRFDRTGSMSRDNNVNASRIQSFAFGDVYDDYMQDPRDAHDRGSYGGNSPAAEGMYEYHNAAADHGQAYSHNEGQGDGHYPHEQMQYHAAAPQGAEYAVGTSDYRHDQPVPQYTNEEHYQQQDQQYGHSHAEQYGHPHAEQYGQPEQQPYYGQSQHAQDYDNHAGHEYDGRRPADEQQYANGAPMTGYYQQQPQNGYSGYDAR